MPGQLPLFVSGDGPSAVGYETSRSNLLAVTSPTVLVTPPLTDEVLPGTRRRRMIDAAIDRGWRVEVRPLQLAELERAELVVVANSLGLSGVSDLDGRPIPMDARLLEVLRGWLD
jgi:branched-subunit amino acid aminotransferase/4-amino-4-deoxychorismate lyase